MPVVVLPLKACLKIHCQRRPPLLPFFILLRHPQPQSADGKYQHAQCSKSYNISPGCRYQQGAVNIHHYPDKRTVDQPFAAQFSRIRINEKLFLCGEIIKAVGSIRIFFIGLKNIVKFPVRIFLLHHRYDLINAIPFLPL